MPNTTITSFAPFCEGFETSVSIDSTELAPCMKCRISGHSVPMYAVQVFCTESATTSVNAGPMHGGVQMLGTEYVLGKPVMLHVSPGPQLTWRQRKKAPIHGHGGGPPARII